MARPLRITYPGAFYHVTSRGNERKAVFKSKSDRLKFLEYLGSATTRYDASIHAYCMLDNHFHLLMETPSGNLPQIMQHINGAYTTYFNIKRGRSGHLFHGRYKAILVEMDAYAEELSRYIHLNPVRAGNVNTPGEYEWSSYPAYVGVAHPPEWLNRQHILSYFAAARVGIAQNRYRHFVESLVGKEYQSPLSDAASGAILGCNEFVERVKAAHLSERPAERDVPALRKLRPQPTGDLIDRAVEERVKDDPRLARDLKIYARQKYTCMTLKHIGFGLSESGVSQVRRRLESRMQNDKALSRLVKAVEKDVRLSRM